MEPGYAEALWKAHPHMNESADFVMYWWDRAADLLTRKGTRLRRFGLVTTNSITQEFSRRTIRRHLNARRSEEHTSELQSLMRISYAVFCLKKKKPKCYETNTHLQLHTHN